MALMQPARRTYRWLSERRLTPRDRLARHWVRDLDGDTTYRLDYPLGPESVVVDVGGFEGQFASDVFGRFACTVHVYEPVAAFAAAISQRFAANPHVHVHPFGLAGFARAEKVAVRGNETSVTVGGVGAETIELRSAVSELAKIGDVDLLKLNIEGAEYELLDALIDAGMMPSVRFLQVQFHDFVEDAVRRRTAIRASLSQTHEVAWDFPFVWESWTRRA